MRNPTRYGGTLNLQVEWPTIHSRHTPAKKIETATISTTFLTTTGIKIFFVASSFRLSNTLVCIQLFSSHGRYAIMDRHHLMSALEIAYPRLPSPIIHRRLYSNSASTSSTLADHAMEKSIVDSSFDQSDAVLLALTNSDGDSMADVSTNVNP